MESRVSHYPLNGRFTMPYAPLGKPAGTLEALAKTRGKCTVAGCSYEDAKPQEGSNHWSCTEYNSNNAWNVNFGTGNVNGNNKYYGYVARAVTAYGGEFLRFYMSVARAYEDCLKGKMSSPQAVAYMERAYSSGGRQSNCRTMDEGGDLLRLAVELWTGTYRPGTSTCFLVKYPKLREVFAAAFRDRIVHHWVCMRLEPLFEERFVAHGNVSFNCRKGYGTDAAVQHVAEGMKRVSEGYRREAWVFRGDLVGFFMSIDKVVLWYLLERFIRRWRKRYERRCYRREHEEEGRQLNCRAIDEEAAADAAGTVATAWESHAGLYPAEGMYWEVLLRTTRMVVMHRPETDCVLNSPPEWWLGLAENKSLFTSESGMPIGNLTTQLFANFLMSWFVSYVQWLMRGREYAMAQFVDDFVLVCDDEEYLLRCVPKIEAFLRDKLRLKLHKDKRHLQTVDKGLLFVGTQIKPGRLYLSNRTRARMMERCEGFRRMMEEKGELNVLDCQRMEQVVNSYLGFCKGRETYAFRRMCIEGMGPLFWKHFYVKGSFESIRTRRRYRGVEI